MEDVVKDAETLAGLLYANVPLEGSHYPLLQAFSTLALGRELEAQLAIIREAAPSGIITLPTYPGVSEAEAQFVRVAELAIRGFYAKHLG